MEYSGKIIKIISNFYYVQDCENKIWECFSRGKLLKEGKLLFVGDNVKIEVSSPSQGVIIDVEKKKNHLKKPPIVNIDQVIVVFSSAEPDFDFYNLDRYLSFIRYELPEEDIKICLNKIDLCKIDLSIYEELGFKVFYLSALTKEGIDGFSKSLTNKTTVLTGPSGVGKSSLIKSLVPEKSIKIDSVSSIKQGKHTTRNIELIPTEDGKGFMADTPAFSFIDFSILDPYEIPRTFSEFNNLHCGYNNCLHNGEEGCILNASDFTELIDEKRYESYLRILEESQSAVLHGNKIETKYKLLGDKKKVIPKISQQNREKSRKRQKQELTNFDKDEQ